jgi:hypothetical protein
MLAPDKQKEQKEYDGFVGRLKRSPIAVGIIAEYLKMRMPECEVTIPELRITPDRAHRKEYFDDGDIYVKCGDKSSRYEVKGEKYEFYGEATLPQSWKQSPNSPTEFRVVVCNKNAFDRADPVPVAFYLCNESNTRAIVIDVAKTREFWYEAVIQPDNYDRPEESYCVDARHVKFANIEAAKRRFFRQEDEESVE